MKWPFLKFYTRDWQSDFELRMCSLEARGFWFECLCIMHNAKRRGFMETPQGAPLSDDQAARLIGTSKGDVERLRGELLEHGVPSVDDDSGVMYCRRMIKDTQKAEKCSAAGKKNGGSPLLRKNKENTDIRIPETRNHISLEVTSKGGLSGGNKESSEEFLTRFNLATGKNHRKLPEKAARQFNARLKDGYTVDDMITATENAAKSEHHKENGMTHLTPELITRGDKLEAWMNAGEPQPKQSGQSGRMRVSASQKDEDYIL